MDAKVKEALKHFQDLSELHDLNYKVPCRSCVAALSTLTAMSEENERYGPRWSG